MQNRKTFVMLRQSYVSREGVLVASGCILSAISFSFGQKLGKNLSNHSEQAAAASCLLSLKAVKMISKT